jgi:hypothetical protein
MPRVPATMQIALLLTVLLVLTALSLLLKAPDKSPEVITNRSIYNSGPSGIRAWYLAAQKAHLPLASWERPFTELDEAPAPSVMLIVQPFMAAQGQTILGTAEVEKLLHWVAQGNTLVLLDDFQHRGARLLTDELGIQIKRAHSERLTPQSADLNRFVEDDLQSRRTSACFWLPSEKDTKILLKNHQKQPVLLRMPYGKGVLILGTSPDLIENQWLYRLQDGNFQFLTNLLVMERKPILINEFVHGYNRVESLFAFLREKTPIGAILMQLIFAFLLVLWLGFTRWVPVLPITENVAKNGGLHSFIDAVAHLYYRRRAASLALQPHIQHIAAILRQRYQIKFDSLAESTQLQNLLEALPRPYSSEEAKNILATLQQAKELAEPDAASFATLSNQELFQLSTALTEFQERLQYVKR